jgi:hypothetical protein
MLCIVTGSRALQFCQNGDKRQSDRDDDREDRRHDFEPVARFVFHHRDPQIRFQSRLFTSTCSFVFRVSAGLQWIGRAIWQ